MPPPADPLLHGVIVLHRDGTVAASAGGPDWTHRHLRELPLSPEARDEVRELLRTGSRLELSEPPETPTRHWTVVVVDALPMHFSMVRVRELLMRTMDVFAAQALTAAVELVVECDDAVPATLDGDSEKLGWLLATLVGNAVRIVRGGCSADAPRVEVRASFLAKEGLVELVVADNGPGMPADMARWLFERDPRTGRTAGLALLMVRDVVLAHGGSIEVESAVGDGARFRILIPQKRVLEARR
jgi:signal transduction histidine kinase